MTEQDKDERNRTFWTAYIVEILLAYNLGRPPSIGEEHITARLPDSSSTMAICIHHIKHRQIQSHIINKVYGIAQLNDSMPEDEQYSVLSRLQKELDEWRVLLPEAYQSSPDSGYSYRYVCNVISRPN